MGETFELYYWPGIPGRGEYPRLALEAAGAPYVDVAREPGGMKRMTAFLRGAHDGLLPFAPPFLRVGDLVVSQTALACDVVARRVGLVPEDEPSRLEALSLALTVADLVAEVHDTHHPVGSGLYYEDQRPEAARRAEQLRDARLPKFLGYFERVLDGHRSVHLVGDALSYVDLSVFHTIEGLRYAFPNAMGALEPRIPRLCALRDEVAAHPRVAGYLGSGRRLAFNEEGIFRHYPELDPA